MPKKIKTKKTSVKRQASTSAAHFDQNTFLLIVGGGLLILILAIFSFGGFDNYTKKPAVENKVQKVMNNAKEQHVEMRDMVFSPSTLRVKAGTTVVFTNRDTVFHNAISTGGEFDTGLLAKGESGRITFSKTGTYNYYCTPHPAMTGTIVVEE